MKVNREIPSRSACTAVAIAGTVLSAVGCTQNTYVVPQTTTVTAIATIEIPAPPTEDYSGRKTVQQALAEGSRAPHVLRAAEAGFGDWSIAEFLDIAGQFCDDLWAGGDFEKVVDELSMNRARVDVLGVYNASAGFTCNMPPGAPVPPGR